MNTNLNDLMKNWQFDFKILCNSYFDFSRNDLDKFKKNAKNLIMPSKGNLNLFVKIRLLFFNMLKHILSCYLKNYEDNCISQST